MTQTEEFMFQIVTYRPPVYKTGVVGDGGRKVKKAMRCIKGQSKTISQTSSVGESNCVTVKLDKYFYGCGKNFPCDGNFRFNL